jgi:hypothetical protein
VDNIGAVKRLLGVCLAAMAVVVGWNVAGAVHELGHAAATLALGGQVLHIRPWYCPSHADTIISHLSDARVSIIYLSGLLATNLVGVGALLAVPWSRLSARVAVLLGLFLYPFAIEAMPFAFAVIIPGVSQDTVLFALHSGCDELLLSFCGQLVLWGSLWFWLRRTRFPKRCREAWSMP